MTPLLYLQIQMYLISACPLVHIRIHIICRCPRAVYTHIITIMFTLLVFHSPVSTNSLQRFSVCSLIQVLYFVLSFYCQILSLHNKHVIIAEVRSVWAANPPLIFPTNSTISISRLYHHCTTTTVLFPFSVDS